MLNALRKNSLIQIENAFVAPSLDIDIYHLQLELRDSPSRLTAVYTLGENMTPIHVVNTNSLDVGLRIPSPLSIKHFRDTSVPWPPSNPRRGRPSFSATDSARVYDYTPIATLADPHGPIQNDPKAKFNVIGVVVDCRAPCITKGKHLRSEIVIADESCVQGDRLVTLPIFTFEVDPKHAVPYRAIGDIVRVHRIHISQYTDFTNEKLRRSGSARYYSTFLLWDMEGSDYEPFAKRDPIGQPTRGHTITDGDRERVKELREWATDYMWTKHSTQRKFMYTVPEVLNADSNAQIFLSNFDLVCFLPNGAFVDDSTGAIKMSVSAGCSNGEESRHTVRVESDRVIDIDSQTSYPFVSFCPSWETRPMGKGTWLVIRDVTLRLQGQERVISLHIGKKSSTIIWCSEKCTDVRKQKWKLGAAENETAHPPPSVDGGNVGTYGYGQTHRTKSAGSAKAQMAGIGDQGMDAQKAPVADNNGMRASDSTTPKRATPRKRRHPDGDMQDGSPTSKVLKDAKGSGLVKELDESGIRTVSVRQVVETISWSEHGGRNLSSIGKMVEELKQKRGGGIYRLRVRARVMSCPKDIRFGCKPWCNRCERYLKIDVKRGEFECVKCQSSFLGSHDPRTGWAYSIKLIMEDGFGGRIDCWVEGKEGSSFFTGLAPANLISNTKTEKLLNRYLQAVLCSKNRLDCCVHAYEYEDGNGLYRVACKMVRTKLKGDVLEGNKC